MKNLSSPILQQAPMAKSVAEVRPRPRLARYYLCLFGVMLLVVSLRFFMLGHQSFWIDEGYTLYFSDGPSFGESVSQLLATDLSDRFRILYYLIIFGWRGLFGDSEVAVRSFSTLCSVTSAVLLYFTARYWFGKSYALWTFLAVAVSAYTVYYSQEARDYALAMMIVSAQLFALSRGFAKPAAASARLFKILFAVFTAFGVLLNVLMLCFSAGLALAHLLTAKHFRSWLSWWLPAALLSIAPLGVYLSAPTASSPDAIGVSRFYLPLMYNVAYAVYGLFAGTTFAPPQILLRTGSKLEVVATYWPMLVWFLLTFATIAAGFFGYWLWQWHRHQEQYRIERFLTYALGLSFALGVLLAYVTKLNWLPRHVFYVSPLIVLLLPALFRQMAVGVPGANRLMRAAACSLLAINLVSLGHYYFGDLYQKDDFRSAAAYVNAHRDANTRSVLIGGAGDTRLMAYYGSPDTLDGKYITESIQTGGFATNVQELTDAAPTVLLVSNREYVVAEAGKVTEAMSELYKLVDEEAFHYFKIYHFEQRSTDS